MNISSHRLLTSITREMGGQTAPFSMNILRIIITAVTHNCSAGCYNRRKNKTLISIVCRIGVPRVFGPSGDVYFIKSEML